VDPIGQALKPRNNAVITRVELAEDGGAVWGNVGRTTDDGQAQTAFGLFLMIKPVAVTRVAVFDIGRCVGRANNPIAQAQVPQRKGLEQRVGLVRVWQL